MRRMFLRLRKDGLAGRGSLSPIDGSDMPMFKHITGGCIAVYADLWDREFAPIAELHGIEVVIEPEDSL